MGAGNIAACRMHFCLLPTLICYVPGTIIDGWKHICLVRFSVVVGGCYAAARMVIYYTIFFPLMKVYRTH